MHHIPCKWAVSLLLQAGFLLTVHSHCCPNDEVTHMFSGVSLLYELQPPTACIGAFSGFTRRVQTMVLFNQFKVLL